MKKYKFCSANEAMQHAPNRLRFFSFGWWWRCWIFIFILLMCSDCDHLKFLMCSSICSQWCYTFYPIRFTQSCPLFTYLDGVKGEVIHFSVLRIKIYILRSLQSYSFLLRS
jgi:hypothetical protein